MFTTLRVSLAPLLLEQESYICHISKKYFKKDIANYRPILFLNLDNKIYTNSYEWNGKKLATKKSEHQPEDTKNRVTLLYKLFLLFVT